MSHFYACAFPGNKTLQCWYVQPNIILIPIDPLEEADWVRNFVHSYFVHFAVQLCVRHCRYIFSTGIKFNNYTFSIYEFNFTFYFPNLTPDGIVLLETHCLMHNTWPLIKRKFTVQILIYFRGVNRLEVQRSRGVQALPAQLLPSRHSCRNGEQWFFLVYLKSWIEPSKNRYLILTSYLEMSLA